MKSNLVIGFLTPDNPLDKRAWSGTQYRMLKSLENEFETVIVLGPLGKGKFIIRMIHLISSLNHLVFRKYYNELHNIILSRYYAYSIRNKIKNKKIDVIFAPTGSSAIAYLKTQIPICYFSDSSFGQLKDYYNSFSSFCSLSIKESDLIEKRAIQSSKTQVYSSEWASKFVIEYYNAEPDRVFVVKFGANFDYIPATNEIEKDYSGPLKLLFLGVDWERKGGEIVFRTLVELQSRGIKTELTVCGCTPPKDYSNPGMKIIPFLNKNEEKDAKLLYEIMHQAHLLFVPTRSDCTPIVFCEAAAFGMPVITTDTGGVSSIVENGINGYALSLEAGPGDYADTIEQISGNREEFNQLSFRSRQRYDEDLNWDVWGRKMKKILLLTYGLK